MSVLLSLPAAFEGLRRRNTLTLPDDRLIFGRRLHQYRRLREWSMTTLAGRSGVSLATCYRLERGQCMPTSKTALKLAAALDVPPALLFRADLRRKDQRQLVEPGPSSGTNLAPRPR